MRITTGSLMLSAVVLLAAVGSASPQEKGVDDLKKEIAALQAEIKAIKAELAKLTRNDAVPTLSEYDKKWVRKLAEDFFGEMLKKRTESMSYETRLGTVKHFVAKDWKVEWVEDPNVKVSHRGARVNRGKPDGFDSYNGYRRVYVEFVFDKYIVDSELIAPAKDEVVIQGKLSGNKTTISPDEDAHGFLPDDRARLEIKEGKFGERTGRFTLRVGREKDTSRWVVRYLSWSVDKIETPTDKK